MQWRRQGVWAYRRIGVSVYGRMGVWAREPGNGRAKNSARPRFGSSATPIRGGFEPRRGCGPRGPNGL